MKGPGQQHHEQGGSVGGRLSSWQEGGVSLVLAGGWNGLIPGTLGLQQTETGYSGIRRDCASSP